MTQTQAFHFPHLISFTVLSNFIRQRWSIRLNHCSKLFTPCLPLPQACSEVGFSHVTCFGFTVGKVYFLGPGLWALSCDALWPMRHWQTWREQTLMYCLIGFALLCLCHHHKKRCLCVAAALPAWVPEWTQQTWAQPTMKGQSQIETQLEPTQTTSANPSWPTVKRSDYCFEPQSLGVVCTTAVGDWYRWEGHLMRGLAHNRR